MLQTCRPAFIRRPSRRGFLHVGAVGSLGLTLGDYFRLEAAGVSPGGVEGRTPPARNVIQIFLPGGFSHLESWDPKPEAPIDIRGPFGVVKTAIPGVVFGELMPRTAAVADKISVVRTVSGKAPDHGLAQYHTLTGYSPTPAIKHPQMGAIISHELGSLNELPAWVGIPAAAGGETGYMPAKYGCFSVGSDPASAGFAVRDLSLPDSFAGDELRRRQDLRAAVEGHFRSQQNDGAAIDTMDGFYRKAYGLLTSSAVKQAFRLDDEPDHIRKLYGVGEHNGKNTKPGAAERLMLARRLVEAGTRFVSVSYGDWDNHGAIKDYFLASAPAFDHAFAGLVTDLDQRGLLDTTLVMVLTEFGRTPKFDSATNGRHHHTRNYSLAIAGGGITRGNVYGVSDAMAFEPSLDGITLEDFLATAYHQLGIDHTKRIMSPGERPIDILREGKPVKGLIT